MYVLYFGIKGTAYVGLEKGNRVQTLSNMESLCLRLRDLVSP